MSTRVLWLLILTVSLVCNACDTPTDIEPSKSDPVINLVDSDSVSDAITQDLINGENILDPMGRLTEDSVAPPATTAN
jgi:hypothetical protein